MQTKEAVAVAKEYAADFFEGEDVARIRLEEIDFNEQSNQWLITLGIFRPSVHTRAAALATSFGNSEYKRSYRVFHIDDDTGRVISMKIRPAVDDE